MVLENTGLPDDEARQLGTWLGVIDTMKNVPEVVPGRTHMAEPGTPTAPDVACEPLHTRQVEVATDCRARDAMSVMLPASAPDRLVATGLRFGPYME